MTWASDLYSVMGSAEGLCVKLIVLGGLSACQSRKECDSGSTSKMLHSWLCWRFLNFLPEDDLDDPFCVCLSGISASAWRSSKASKSYEDGRKVVQLGFSGQIAAS